MNKKQRTIVTIAAAVLLAVVLAVVFPSRVTADNRLSGSLLSHNSQLISQKEVATSLDPQASSGFHCRRALRLSHSRLLLQGR